MTRTRWTGTTTRRGLLRGAAGVTTAAVGTVTVAGEAAAQASFGGWMSDVENYDGVVDRTGREEVTVRVGVDNGGQPFGFGPAAVRVDPGTTVVWEWTGKGGQHNVVDDGGSFESELTQQEGFTFEHAFESEGVTKYYCAPHQSLGMKGVVVVGDIELGGGGEPFEPPGGDFGFTFMGILFGMLGVSAVAVLGADAFRSYSDWRASVTDVEGPAVESPPESVERSIEHDEFDPTGAAALLIGYFIVLVVLWILMYFVEFLGGGPTIVG